MNDLVSNASNIISEAAKSPLGLFALMLLILGILGFVYFRKASEKTRVGIFLLIFSGIAGFVFLTFRNSSVSSTASEGSILQKDIVLSNLGFEDGMVPWYKAGNKPNDYAVEIDRAVFYKGNAGVRIRSVAEKAEGFGTVMRSGLTKTEPYKGKRLRLSAYVKTDSVSGWAGLWMRVDAQNETVNFDNMGNRPIIGTTDWKRYEIILDVPKSSVSIPFGVLLDGTGTIWADDFQLEEVSQNVPVTNLP